MPRPALFACLFLSGMICSCERGYTPEPNGVATGGIPAASSIVAPVTLKVTSMPAEPEKVNITFSSDPPAVDIWMDGVFIGVSPKVVSLLKENKEVTFEFKKDGYVTATQKLTLDANRPVIAKLRAAPQDGAKKKKL